MAAALLSLSYIFSGCSNIRMGGLIIRKSNYSMLRVSEQYIELKKPSLKFYQSKHVKDEVRAVVDYR